MIGIDDVRFDLSGLTLLKTEKNLREWVNPLGAYLMVRLSLDRPSLPASVDQLSEALRSAPDPGRLVFFETLRVDGVMGVIFVAEMAFNPDELDGVGQTPSYTATMTVPLASCSVDFNAAYNTRLAELSPTGNEAGSLDDPPAYLLALLRSVAATLQLHGALGRLPPFWADG